MSAQEVRRRRLGEAIEHYGVQLQDTTAGEDLAPYLDAERDVPRYAAVSHTSSEGYAYITPADSRGEALGYLERVVADSIYPEAPLYVLDLDAGTRQGVAVALTLGAPEGPGGGA